MAWGWISDRDQREEREWSSWAKGPALHIKGPYDYGNLFLGNRVQARLKTRLSDRKVLDLVGPFVFVALFILFLCLVFYFYFISVSKKYG